MLLISQNDGNYDIKPLKDSFRDRLAWN
ncbi:uncharacterized protein METZ01_LOCUS495437 [marine metagenome]|uniref:Uncharacterized protein n=1 Tax=marine metagenome TaxID=408172 RepID=A0A383DE34_9ZZZZ